jgi:uncharacterized protein YlxW (UPF0749 family)
VSSGESSRTVWHIGVLAVCLVAGLMVATAQRSAEENQLQVTESTRLSDLVRSAQANAEKVSADRDELAAQLDSLQEDAARSDAGVAAALGDIKNISADAGLTEMTGPGAAEPGIRIYKQYATRFGLGYTQATPSQITVPAYTGG